ncbi:hypothetical protein, partial [Escherichia coli]|uniref:hypothetical protein n=1 Tax=Escherichia coli TaxID=562 RepID=UPI003CE55381
HELVNSGTAAKNLLLILLVGVVLGTHSAQIKQSLGQIISPASIGYAAKKSAVTAPSKLDKVGLDVVSSDEYLFSSLYE